ncbi:MAG: carboxypeptidase regulatory-like domain-containing protein [Planctomycetota bacterium]
MRKTRYYSLLVVLLAVGMAVVVYLAMFTDTFGVPGGSGRGPRTAGNHAGSDGIGSGNGALRNASGDNGATNTSLDAASNGANGSTSDSSGGTRISPSETACGDPEGAIVRGVVIDSTTGNRLPGQTVTLAEDATRWVWNANTYQQARNSLLAASDDEQAAITTAREQLMEQRRAVVRNMGTSTTERTAAARKLEDLARLIRLLDEAGKLWTGATAILKAIDEPKNLNVEDTARGMTALILARDVVRRAGNVAAGNDDENGDAPTGAAIITGDDTQSAGRHWTATSADDGTFEFRDVPPRMYGIVAQGPEFLSETTAVFTLNPGEEREVELRVTPAGRFTGTVVDASGTPIAGAQVQLADASKPGEEPAFKLPGAPKPQGTVSAFDSADTDTPPDADSMGLEARARMLATERMKHMPGSGTTDNEGRYVLRAPNTPGRYRVAAWDDKHQPGQSEPADAKARENTEVAPIVLQPLAGLRVTVLTDTPEEPVAAQFVPGPEVSPDGTEHFPIPDRQTFPVFNALVRVLNQQQMNELGITDQWDGLWDTKDIEWRVRRQIGDAIRRTDAQGEVLYVPLPAGKWFVKVRKRGYLSSEQYEIDVTNNALTELTIDLRRGLVLTGKVVDFAGEPVPGATITPLVHVKGERDFGVKSAEARHVEMVKGADGKMIAQVAEWGEREVKTNYLGLFTVGGISEGAESVDLQVDAVGFLPQTAVGVPTDGTLIKVELKRAMRVEGDVRYADGTPPMPGFSVFLRPADAAGEETAGPQLFNAAEKGSWALTTRADGHFIFSNVIPGKYQVEALDSNSAPTRSEPFEVVRDQSVDGLLITLSAGGTISGVVVDSAGAAVEGAIVTADDRIATFARSGQDVDARFRNAANGDPETMARLTVSARTNADGTFRIEHVKPGEYTLIGAHPAHARGQVEGVRVNEGADTPGVRIELTAGGTIRGVVLTPEGQPLANMEIGIGSEGWRTFPRNVRSDKEGRFEFAALDPGLYRIQPGANPNPGQAAIGGKTVRIKGGETIEIQLGGAETGGCRVTIEVQRNGQPYANGELNLASAGAGIRRGRTDANGRVTFENVAQGAYVAALNANRHPTNFYISPGEAERRIEIRVEDGVLRGKVVDASGNPISGVNLSISQAPSEPGAFDPVRSIISEEERTNASGQYRFGQVAAGTWRLLVRKDGFSMADVTVHVGTDTTEQDITLQAGGGRIKGRVTGYVSPDAIPFVRGWVRLERADGSPVMLGTGSHLINGPEFLISGLAVGTYNVVVQQDGGIPLRKNGVVVKEGETTELEFAIQQAGAVRINITGDFGAFIGEDFSNLSFEILDGSTQLEQLFSPVDFIKAVFSPTQENSAPVEPGTSVITIGSQPPGNFTQRKSKPGIPTETRAVKVTARETTSTSETHERE